MKTRAGLIILALSVSIYGAICRENVADNVAER